jgi:hypothetical protein
VNGWPDKDCPYCADPACTTPANCGAALDGPEEETT